MRLGFTGHEEDFELGLVNMVGRLYDPKIGRFLTPDPVTTDLSGQGLNGYSYVRNNPLTFVDPLGLQADMPLIGISEVAPPPSAPPPDTPPGPMDYHPGAFDDAGLTPSALAPPPLVLPGVSTPPVSLVQAQNPTGAASFWSIQTLDRFTNYATAVADVFALGAGPPLRDLLGLSSTVDMSSPDYAIGHRAGVLADVSMALISLRISLRPQALGVGSATSRGASPTVVDLNEYFGSVVTQVSQRLARDPTYSRLSAMNYGKLVEREVARKIQAGPMNPYFRYIGGSNNRFFGLRGSPDWAGQGPIQGLYFDVTTPGRQVGEHLARPYGENLIIHTYTRSAILGGRGNRP